MIIDGYLWHQAIRPALAAFLLLTGIFFCYAIANILTNTVSDGLGQKAILTLAMLHVLIAAPSLLTTAYYLGVITSLSRLYRESEFLVMLGLGWSEWRLARSILSISVALAICTGILVTWVRPWAYNESYRIEEESMFDAQIIRNIAGSFIPLGSENRVLNANSIDAETNELLDVFLHLNQDTQTTEDRIILAKRGRISSSTENKQHRVRLYSGTVYWLNEDGQSHREHAFDELQFVIDDPSPTGRDRKRRALSTLELSQSDSPKEIAEFQWRLSAPLATLVLGALAIPLSRTGPRQSGNRQLVFALLVYGVIFYLASAVQNWVENGTLSTTPGIWFVWIIVAVYVGLLYIQPTLAK